MKAVNTIKVTFPAISRNEGLARSVIAAFVSQLDPTVEELSDIRAAVSEAVREGQISLARAETFRRLLQSLSKKLLLV